RTLGAHFPWGTLTANVLGSFAMGVFVELLVRRFDVSPEVRLLVTTGILGSFTTFSAFSLDVAVLWERGATVPAALYAGMTVVLSISALFAGLSIVRAFSS
ncbi:MAG: CrcB family protein, partial [Pseudomonadota bacterium]